MNYTNIMDKVCTGLRYGEQGMYYTLSGYEGALAPADWVNLSVAGNSPRKARLNLGMVQFVASAAFLSLAFLSSVSGQLSGRSELKAAGQALSRTGQQLGLGAAANGMRWMFTKSIREQEKNVGSDMLSKAMKASLIAYDILTVCVGRRIYDYPTGWLNLPGLVKQIRG